MTSVGGITTADSFGMGHSSINGLGERAWNVASEEIAPMLLHLLDVDAGIDLSRLKSISDLFSEVSKARPARNKAVVGDGLFEVESGIVIHELERLRGTPLESRLFLFTPEMIGHDPYKVILGRGMDCILFTVSFTNLILTQRMNKLKPSQTKSKKLALLPRMVSQNHSWRMS